MIGTHKASQSPFAISARRQELISVLTHRVRIANLPTPFRMGMLEVAKTEPHGATTSLSGNDAHRSSAFKSSNAPQLTVGTVAMRIRQQATESNIHCGISRSRPPGFSSTPHRHTARPFLVKVSWTATVRACQGCQGNGLLAIQYYGCCFVDSYNQGRPHWSLGPGIPEPAAVLPPLQD